MLRYWYIFIGCRSISDGVNQLGGLTIDIISINKTVCLMVHFVLGTQAVRMFFFSRNKVSQSDFISFIDILLGSL